MNPQIFSIKNVPALLIILFVVQGIIFSGMYPLWDPWDEPAHFAYIQHIVEAKTLPIFEDYLSNEMVFTFDKTPMVVTWLIDKDCCNVTDDVKYYYLSEYWKTFDLEEAQKNKELISSQTLESRATSEPFIANYEAGQPPLGYLVQVPVYLLFYDQDILTRVFALRIFSILVTAIAAVVAYKTISLLFDDRFIRLGSLMFIVFNPMFTNDISRVSNEAITILLFSIFLFLMVLYLKGKTNTLHVVLIGVVLGLGLLTKATFMPAVILVPVFIFLRYIQNNSNKLRSLLQPLKNLGLILGIAILSASWWYYEGFATGNPTGVIDVQGVSLNHFIQGIILLEWSDYFWTFFVTFWGFFGTSLHMAPGGFFGIVMIMVWTSVAGLGFGIVLKVKQHGRKIFRNWKYQSIFALALSTFFIILAQSLFNVQIFLVMEGRMFPNGWFTFISFTAIAMVSLLGYRTIIINTKLRQLKEEFLLIAFIILIILNTSTFYWLIPKFYAGG